MAKILVKDLEKLAKEFCKDKEIVQFRGLDIELKQYLTILEKIKLISSIYESAVDRTDGLHIVKGTALDIAFKVLFIKTYTNITLPQNEIEAYNLITETGLYDFVYDKLPDIEKCELQQVLNNHIQTKQDEYEQRNTIQYIVKDLFGGLIDKLPSLEEAKKFIEDASKEIEGFDPSKLEFVNQFLAFNKGE